MAEQYETYRGHAETEFHSHSGPFIPSSDNMMSEQTVPEISPLDFFRALEGF
jgi:hypothetical protein